MPLEDGMVSRMHSVVHDALNAVQTWLGEPYFAGSQLLILTAGAVSIGDEPIDDIAAAAVWGLVRSAQSEDPERILLADTDTDGVPELRGLVAQVLAAGEPQVAIRKGVVHTARATRLPATANTGTETELRARLSVGSVVITGGTGGLGAMIARHLVSAYGARSLILASRRGRSAPGATETVAELTALGARVTLLACDVSTRSGVEALIAAVPQDAPLVGVVHTAGVLDDGVVSSLTPQRVDTVLAAKADAAWWLHEATRDLDLALFVLYSSAAGTLGTAGQGNYAAANTFLDALAEFRCARGAAAVSIAWGLWDTAVGMGARLRGEDTTRLGRDGILALTPEQGLSWFDTALVGGQATVIAARLDLSVLSGATVVPSILRGLIRANRRAVDHTATAVDGVPELQQRILGLPETEALQRVLDTVRLQVARVLGHEGIGTVDPDRNFRELGFDSLTAVEIRNQLNAVTGLRLPTTLVFDYPSPRVVAEHILVQFDKTAPRERLDSAVDEKNIRDYLATVPLSELRRIGMLDSVLALMADAHIADIDTVVEQELTDDMDIEALIQHVIDNRID
ncbi:beta-ketoacyl reductase [Nocardia sp. NPDC058497]|uniref:type I polyketide synthase n=1 Tax=Nocardia sp. NPDC058497 TaxID=3346529 RepID=UPI00365F87B1